MRSLFVANVGNRDVVLNLLGEGQLYASFDKGEDGDAVAKELGCEPGTRAIAAYLRQNLERYLPRLRLPILLPGLTAAFQQAGSIDLLVLLATDQDSAPQEHRMWDTIESARLIQGILETDPQYAELGIKQIEVLPIQGNPSNYEYAYKVVGQHLGQINSQFAPPQWVFAASKGGVPALNAALRSHTVDIYGAKAVLVETDEPTKEQRQIGQVGTAKRMDSWPFRKSAFLRVLSSLLERYDYVGVGQLLESERITDPTVWAYIRHAQARFNLNFFGAKAALEGYHSGKANHWRISTDYNWQRQRLRELAWVAGILHERGDYVGFITRIASMCEVARRQAVYHLIGLKLEKGFLAEKTVRQYPGLSEFLMGKTRFYDESKYRVDRDLLSALLDWWVLENPASAELVINLRKALEPFNGLEARRNEALHSQNGTSRQDIEEAFGEPSKQFGHKADELVVALERIERYRGHQFGESKNVYDEINVEVLSLIGQIA